MKTLTKFLIVSILSASAPAFAYVAVPNPVDDTPILDKMAEFPTVADSPVLVDKGHPFSIEAPAADESPMGDHMSLSTPADDSARQTHTTAENRYALAMDLTGIGR